jgi:hydroxymethylpyrimidine/phosphomethylpyrimidine kinase
MSDAADAPADRTPVVLSIAGSDPSGAAGLQLDLRVLALHGVHGMAVPTALVIQHTGGVKQVLPAFPEVVGRQLEFLLSDVTPDAIKLGMLATDDVLLRVARSLERTRVPRVVDPVLRASDGNLLLERRAWTNLVEHVVAGAALVTPNRDEAEALTGESDPEKAARALRDAGANAVLVKGGHAAGEPHDFLLGPDGGTWLEGRRIGAEPVRGTGCALASAIAARLARGEALEPAVRGAKRFVEAAIAAAFRPGKGGLVLGLAHFARSM